MFANMKIDRHIEIQCSQTPVISDSPYISFMLWRIRESLKLSSQDKIG